MADQRLRDLERDLAAHPTPAARDRLAAERARRGDGPWLPVLAADLARWSEAIFCEKIEMLFREWEATAAPGDWSSIGFAVRPIEARGVSAFHAIREQMAAIDEAQRRAGLAFPWVDPLAEARATAEALAALPPPTTSEIASARGVALDDWIRLHLGRPAEDA